MVHLGNMLQSLLFPPGVFIVALVVAQFFLVKADRRVRIALTALTAAMYLSSIGATAYLVGRPLERTYPALSSDARPDAIVVLGGGASDGALDQSDGRGLDPHSSARVLYAAHLQMRFGTPVIVTGGDPNGQGFSEAVVMRRELIRLGVPASMVMTEERSRDTYENAAFARQVARKAGFEQLALVTSALHMPRAVDTFRARGMSVMPAPTDYLVPGELTLLDWLPSAEAQRDLVAAMHERVGRAWYRVRFGV